MAGKANHNKQTDKELYRDFFSQVERQRAAAHEGVFEIKTVLMLLAAANDEKFAEDIYLPHLTRIFGMLVDKIDEPLKEMDALIIKQPSLAKFCDERDGLIVKQKGLMEFRHNLECQRNEAISNVFKIRTILALLAGYDKSVKDLLEMGIDLFSIKTVLQSFVDKADDSLDEMDGLIIAYPDEEDK